MDSFMIYTEPFVLTGGGPGTATTFLSQYLTQKAVGQFDLGPAAAFSLVYFLIILLLCFVLYNFMKDAGDGARGERAMSTSCRRQTFPGRALLLVLYLALHARAHLLDGAHEPAHATRRSPARFAWLPESLVARELRDHLHRPAWYGGYINSIIYVVLNTVLSVTVALPAAYAFSRYRFLGDKHLFFWLLTNRMTPPAVFLLPFFQLYTSVGLMDTHLAVALAHMVFNVPLAVWILEGFMSRRAARDRRDGVHRRLFASRASS